MIEIKNLQKKYDSENVLRDISLEIEDKEIFGLIGLSGAGKSTLLRCINGLIPYEEGILKVNGVEINSLNNKELRNFRKRMGMIFQNFALLERLTVYENIAFPMRIWKMGQKEIDQQVCKMAELVGLEEKLKSKPRELSGGQKQRVAIARALVMEPQLLLCDEATSALDPKTGKSILNLLKEINKNLGITMILVTHQMEVIEQVCDRMALLQDGRIVLQENVKEMFLKNTRPLRTLLGQEEKKEPGIFYRVLIDDERAYRSFFQRISEKTSVRYEVTTGSVKEFKDGPAFLGTLKILENEKEFSHFLNEQNIQYEARRYET